MTDFLIALAGIVISLLAKHYLGFEAIVVILLTLILLYMPTIWSNR